MRNLDCYEFIDLFICFNLDNYLVSFCGSFNYMKIWLVNLNAIGTPTTEFIGIHISSLNI